MQVTIVPFPYWLITCLKADLPWLIFIGLGESWFATVLRQSCLLLPMRPASISEGSHGLDVVSSTHWRPSLRTFSRNTSFQGDFRISILSHLLDVAEVAHLFGTGYVHQILDVVESVPDFGLMNTVQSCDSRYLSQARLLEYQQALFTTFLECPDFWALGGNWQNQNSGQLLCYERSRLISRLGYIVDVVIKSCFIRDYSCQRWIGQLVLRDSCSVRNFGCPCARDSGNQKSRRATKNTDAVVRRTTINL